MLDEVLEAAQSALAEPAGAVARWRATHSGPAIGYLPYDMPVEIIHAAGALPVAVLPPGPGGEQVEAHLPGWICSPARRFLAAARRHELGWADGLVIPGTCDTMRGLKGLWQFLEAPPFLEPYFPPRATRPSAVPYLAAELARLVDRVGAFAGHVPDAGDLAASIAIYDGLRRELARVFGYHVQNPDAVTNRHWYTLVRAAMVLPPEEMTALLAKVAAPPESTPATGVRVLVSGQLMEPPELAGLMDDAGLVAVGDDLVDGQRFLRPAPADPDPLTALARQACSAPPGKIQSGREPREAYLAALARECRAVGVVFVHFRNCEMENLGYPGLRDRLEKQGLPTLQIETQWGTAAAGAVVTRLEAFREMLEGV